MHECGMGIRVRLNYGNLPNCKPYKISIGLKVKSGHRDDSNTATGDDFDHSRH